MYTEIVYFKIYNLLSYEDGDLVFICRRCFVEISSVIFGHLWFRFFKYEKIFILRMDMYVNVVNLRMSLKTLISLQIYGKTGQLFIIGIYDWWHRWNGVVFSTNRMNKFLNKRNFLCNSDGIIVHARSPGSLRIPQQTLLLRYTLPKNFFYIHKLHVHCTCTICSLKRMEHSVHNILNMLR